MGSVRHERLPAPLAEPADAQGSAGVGEVRLEEQHGWRSAAVT